MNKAQNLTSDKTQLTLNYDGVRAATLGGLITA